MKYFKPTQTVSADKTMLKPNALFKIEKVKRRIFIKPQNNFSHMLKILLFQLENSCVNPGHSNLLFYLKDVENMLSTESAKDETISDLSMTSSLQKEY